MRTYKLVIQDAESKSPIKTFYGGYNEEVAQPSVVGVNVAFEIKIFTANFAQMPSQIRIDNAFDIDSFKELLKYPYMEMVLYAGWLESSAFIKRNSYQSVIQNPIIQAPITNAIPDFSGITKKVYLHYNPTQSIATPFKKLQQTKRFTMTLHTGEKVIDQLTAYINSQIKNPYNQKTGTEGQIPTIVALDENAQNAIWAGGDTIINGDTIASFFQEISRLTFNRGVRIVKLKITMNDMNIITIATDEPQLPEVIAGTSPDNAIELQAQDFIVQPNLLNLIGSLNVIIRIRQDIMLGTYVKISGARLQTGGVATKVSTGTSLNNPAASAGVIYSDNIYQVIAINYMGEYYDTSPHSWTAQLTLQAADEATSELLFRQG